MLKRQLRGIYEDQAKNFLFKIRQETREKGEGCTAALFRSVRDRKEKQVIVELEDKKGGSLIKVEEINGYVRDHFKKFFSEREVVVEKSEMFVNFLSKVVPEEVRVGLDSPITIGEVEGVVKRMSKGKVPGIDGLPVKFYVRFFSILGIHLVEVIRKVLEERNIRGSMATGVITLLYKKGERSDIANYRPLTMLSVDYKIIAKLLADRLRKALPHVVHVDQTCGVEGRSIKWNLQLIRDVIAWAEDRELPLMVVSLDQAKAFDRVNRGFMFKVMERMGFGENFTGWIRALYTGSNCLVKVNGNVGLGFEAKGGVRQGCPLSPLLFILYMEPVAEAIRLDNKVKGFVVPGAKGAEVKLSQYADDTSLLLMSDRCLEKALSVFEEFSLASGASLNVAKSAIKFFGKFRMRRESLGGLQVCEGPLKILGIHFQNEGSATVNWVGRISSVQKRLARWKGRRLSLMGKVLVVKMDVLPVLQYLAYIYPLPASMRRAVIRLLFNFVWGGRYEYVKRSEMFNHVSKGGRDVPHIPLKLDCLFVSSTLAQLAKPVEHPSGYFLRLFFSYQARHVMKWTNDGPKAEVQPWHYRHAARWLEKYPEGKDRAVCLVQRKLYGKVRERVSSKVGVGVQERVWLNIQPKRLDNGLKDLNWLCFLGRLPVKEVMYRHGLSRDDRCPREGCLQEETIRHTFWECDFAHRVWGGARRVLRVVSDHFRVSGGNVIGGIRCKKGEGKVARGSSIALRLC